MVEHGEFHVIRVLDTGGTHILVNLALGIIQVFLEAGQVVFGNRTGQTGCLLDAAVVRVDAVGSVRLAAVSVIAAHLAAHHAAQVEGLGVDGDRVGGHRVTLDVADVCVHASRHR